MTARDAHSKALRLKQMTEFLESNVPIGFAVQQFIENLISISHVYFWLWLSLLQFSLRLFRQRVEFGFELAFRFRRHAVDEKNPLQVIELVLHRLGEQAAGPEGNFLAFVIHRRDFDCRGTRDIREDFGKTQTAFRSLEQICGRA